MNSHSDSPVSSVGFFRLEIREDLLSTKAVPLRTRITQELDAASATRPSLFEVDLRGARIVDSVGLNLLVMVIKRVRTWGGKTRILLDDSNVRRTLQFTRLDSHAEIVMR